MRSKKSDYPLAVSLFLLIFAGIFILASVSAVLSQEKFGYPTYYLVHQIVYGVIIGLVLGFIAFKIPMDFFRKWALLIFVMNLVLVALVFIPKIGIHSGGASRWLAFGSMSFQPAELLKITFIIYLAAWLAAFAEKADSRKKKEKKSNVILGAFLVIMACLSALLIAQPNVGTLGILFGIALLMYFGSGNPIWHLGLIAGIGFATLAILIRIAPYRLQRFLVFANPDLDPLGMGYQMKQALIAVGSGGIVGVGLGLSRQKFGFLPQSLGDSIFAIFAEEAGFIGALILISLFLFFIWRGISVSKNSTDKFSQLVCLGIISWIGFQAFVNIGAMIGILPLTGIPLPFVSYGGSHVIAELIGAGLLLNISKNT